MANDLVTRLYLDSSNWNSGLSGATTQVSRFKSGLTSGMSGVKSFASELGAGAMKFSGWAAAGTLAAQGLKKFIEAGRQTSEWVENNVNAWKDTFDAFFEELNYGDVSSFLSNMGAVKDAIYEASEAADDLKRGLSSMGILDIQFNTRLINARKKYMTGNPAQKKEAQAEVRNVIAERRNATNGKKELAYLNAAGDINVRRSYQGYGWSLTSKRFSQKDLKLKEYTLTPQQYMNMLQLDVNGGPRRNKIYQEALSIGKRVEQFNKGNYRTMGGTRDAAEIYLMQVGTAFSKRNGGLLPWYVYDYYHLNGKKREAMLGALGELARADESQAEFESRANRMLKYQTPKAHKTKITKIKTNVTPTDKNEYVNGSIGWYNNEIDKLQSQLDRTTSDVDYAIIETKISDLEKALLDVQLKIKDGFTDDKIKQLNENNPISSNISNRNILSGVSAQKAPDVLTYVNINDQLNDTTNIDNTTKSIQALAASMNALSGVTGNTAGAWLQYGANVLQACAVAIPQLRALFVAQESTAAAGAAASGAAAGGPLGWLTGLAALASMIAALAAVPKFARGGIVGGTSYSGDYVNARVNSGEMILNRTQQSNLLAMANGHGGGGNAVHFEIKGSDLVGVLSNYNKKVGKYS